MFLGKKRSTEKGRHFSNIIRMGEKARISRWGDPVGCRCVCDGSHRRIFPRREMMGGILDYREHTHTHTHTRFLGESKDEVG